jgi:WD40 repeat protein
MKTWNIGTALFVCAALFTAQISAQEAVTFSADGQLIASATVDGTVKLWNAESGREFYALSDQSSGVTAIAFSPDGRRIVAASRDTAVKLWNEELREWEPRTLEGHKRTVASAVFSPDGRRVLSASWDTTMKLWDLERGIELRTLSGHSGALASAVFSPDGRRILSASRDTTAKLWDAETGAALRTLSGHSGALASAVFSADGRRVLSASWDRTAKVWDVETGAALHTLSGHNGAVTAAVFSPDGRRIVSASEDTTVKIWDGETGIELHTLSGHSRSVELAAFSSDGLRIISVSEDGTMKLWNVETGSELRAFSDRNGMIISAAFSPDGRRIVSISGDGTVKVWNGESGAELLAFSGRSSNGGLVNRAFGALSDRNGNDDSINAVWKNINLSLDTDVLENGSKTDFSLGCLYAPSIAGELRLRYIKTSYNDNMYDLEESLTANDDLTFETFLLPFRYHFFNNSTLSFNAAAGLYYDYNALDQHGYFNMPDLGDDSLNMYRNDFSMHLLGPLAEAGLRLRTRPVDLQLNLGIVPIFYLRRDQSMQMKPYMGTGFFDHSQDTSGSPYFYGELSGIFFRILSLSLLYEYSRIDYDVISIDDNAEWTTPMEELVSQSFKIEASILLPLGGGFSLQVGYGHGFNTIALDSSTPVDDTTQYLIIGTKKMAF